jgi:putative hydrolase of the HAD superfamily
VKKTGIPAGSSPVTKPSGTEDLRQSVKAVLFDMDNTLFDLVGAQISACHAVTRMLGRDGDDSLFEYFLRPVHGFESHENILDYLHDHDIPADGTYTTAKRVYEQEKIRFITPYPGVIETLHLIRETGLPMGIVTDAHSRDAILRLEKAGLLPYFSGIVSYDMVLVKKPAYEPFLLALKMLKTRADEALLIGDSPRRDIEPCRQLGIRTVYARYGDRFSDDRSDVVADFTIDTMTELLHILYRFSGPEK